MMTQSGRLSPSGRKGFVQPLDAPLGIDEGSVLLQARAGGKNHVGEAAGLAEENILHDEKLELGKSLAHFMRI